MLVSHCAIRFHLLVVFLDPRTPIDLLRNGSNNVMYVASHQMDCAAKTAAAEARAAEEAHVAELARRAADAARQEVDRLRAAKEDEVTTHTQSQSANPLPAHSAISRPSSHLHLESATEIGACA